MAVNQGLNVRLSADASQFIATLQAALAQAQAAASGMGDASSSMNALANAANTANAAAASLNSSLNQTTQATNQSGTATLNASRGYGVFIRSLAEAVQQENAFTRAVNSGTLAYGANADAARRAGRGTVSSAADINSSTLQAARGFGVFQRSLFDTYNAQQQFVIAARNGTLTLGRIGQAATSTARQITTIPPAANAAAAAVSRFGSGTGKAGQIATNFGRILSDLPFGFIAIQNNIDPLVASLGLHAGIGLAFTIAGAAATTLIMRYGSLSNAIKELTGTMTEADRAQQRFNDILKEGGKAAGPQIAQLELLRSALLDTNITQKERIGLVGEYNKVADEGNKISKNQINDLSVINRLINTQIELIGKRAIAQAAENKLGEEAAKLLEVQIRTKPILDRVTNALLAQSTAAADAAKGAKNLRLATADQVAADPGYKKAVQDQFASLAKIRSSPEFIAAEKELRAATEEFNKQLGQITDVVDIDGLIGAPDKGKAGKSIKSVSDVLSKLQDELMKTNALFVNSGDTLQKLTDDQIKNYETALKSLIDIKILPGNTIYDQLKERRDALLGTKPIAVPIQLNPVFTLIPAMSNSIFGPNLLNVHFKPQVDNFTRDLNNLIQSSLSSGIASISSAIGAALVTGDLNSIFSAFVGVVSTFMEKLGAALIAQGAAVEAFKKSLEAGQGIPAIIAGGALIAAAAAFKAIASGGPSFAKGGGIVGGPQLAMIGDNPGREEYVIPSEVLDRLGGGGPRVVRVVGVLRGQDIAFANQRATRAKSRIN